MCMITKKVTNLLPTPRKRDRDRETKARNRFPGLVFPLSSTHAFYPVNWNRSQ